MNILHLCAGQDTGGQAIATKRAFAELAPEHNVTVVTSTQTYLGYGTDLRWSWPLVERLYSEADVVVMHRTSQFYERLDRRQRKPVVVHHHGTRLRQDPQIVWQEGASIGAVQIVSTVDLLNAVPDGETARWVPQIVDVGVLRAIRAEQYRDDGIIRVAHAPTDRAIKSTAEVIAAVKRLSRKYPVELVLIEHVSWTECLARKATADIYIDQVLLGYGNNSLEAWAMGMPVIAGAEEPILARMRKEYRRKEPPFFSASPATIEAKLEALIASPALRAKWAKRGMDHVNRFHTPSAVVGRLIDVYGSAEPTVGGLTRQEAAEVAYVAKISARENAREIRVRRLQGRRAERELALERHRIRVRPDMRHPINAEGAA